MNLLNLRKRAKLEFRSRGIDEVDADFVIAETLNCPITELSLVEQVTDKQLKQIENNLKKRKAKMPVTKIFKRAYFYGLKFKIDNHVLSPRQDSEILVETALKHIGLNKYSSVLDLCTGSGCLAISVKKNANITMTATDISAHALKLARQNAKTLGAEIKFIKSDMFNKVKDKFNLIISNPPYIETQTCLTLDDEVKLYDPLLALDGGADGLDFYRIISANAHKFLTKNGMLILEIGYNQKDAVLNLFKNYKFIECVKDLGGNDRVMVFKIN